MAIPQTLTDREYQKFKNTGKGVYVLTAHSNLISEVVELIEDYELTASFADVGDVISTDVYSKIGLWVDATANNSEDVDLKVIGLFDSDGDTFEIDGVDEKRLWAGSGTTLKKYYEFEVGTIPYLQVQLKAGTLGTPAGIVTINITKV